MEVHAELSDVLTSLLIGFGSSKITEMWKQLMRDVKLSRFPPQGDMLIATSCALGASALLARDRKILVALGSAGMASMIHNIERVLQSRGDLNRQTVNINGGRLRSR